jgi:glutathione S-transferase
VITLLDIPLSPYAQKVKLALLEKNIAFETQLPDLEAQGEIVRAQNPRVEVPVLLDGELSIYQSTIIVQYLEEQYPSPPLLPSTPAERVRVRTLEEICGTAYDAVNWGVSEILVFKRAEGATAERILERAKTQIEGLNARLERELAQRPWFNGSAFGFGDIAVYPFVNGAAAQGFKPEPGSKLQAWLKAVRARPSAERLKQDILTTLSQYLNRPQQIASGQARRQYRDHRVDWMLRSGGVEIVLAGMQAGNIRFSYDFE